MTREITSYIKGLAIAAVLINHYAIFYFQSLDSYANSFIAVFFLLSGAGIALSLEKDVARRGWRPALGLYLLKRGGRIYPLFWLAYAIILLELSLLGQLFGFDLFSLLTALAGVPTNPRGIFWFVTSILQCYLLAPLLFAARQRAGAKIGLAVALAVAAALVPFTPLVEKVVVNKMVFDMITYRSLLLGNVLLFFLGMLLPAFVKIMRERFEGILAIAGATMIFGSLIYASDAPGPWQRTLVPLLLAGAWLFCLSLAAADIRLPLSRAVRLMGDHSYPLYLFHQAFFIALAAWGVIRPGSLVSVLFTALLFPLFLTACVILQRLQGRLTRSLLKSRGRVEIVDAVGTSPVADNAAS